MSLGLTIFTLVHVALSLVGIGSGLVVVYQFLAAKRRDTWAVIFLSTTVLTSVTGFFFPVEHFMPSHAVGIVSLLVLAVAIVALYAFHQFSARPLSERLRSGRAAFSKGAGPPCTGADPVGAVISADTARRVGTVRRRCHWRDDPVSPRCHPYRCCLDGRSAKGACAWPSTRRSKCSRRKMTSQNQFAPALLSC